MIVLAVDPGPTKWGVAIVRIALGKLSLVEGVHRVIDPRVHVDVAWVAARINEVKLAGGAVVVEQIRGFAYDATRVQALVETGRAEGGLLWIAMYLGARHEGVAANDVRRDLVMDAQASDTRIAVVVEWLYGPGIRERIPDPEQRTHVYDAILLAAWWLARESKRAIELPANVVAELLRIQAAERAKSAAKKADRKMAEPVAKRLAGLVKARAIPTLPALAAMMGGSVDTMIAALRVVARGRSDVATAARGILHASGVPTTDPAKKRIGTRVQRAVRKQAAQKGASTRKGGTK